MKIYSNVLLILFEVFRLCGRRAAKTGARTNGKNKRASPSAFAIIPRNQSGFYLEGGGEGRSGSFAPKKPSFTPKKVLLLQYIIKYIRKIIQVYVHEASKPYQRTQYIATFLKVVSQNALGCISAHINFKKFLGAMPPEPQGNSWPRPLRTSSPSEKF